MTALIVLVPEHESDRGQSIIGNSVFRKSAT